jgi:hypothetical protein
MYEANSIGSTEVSLFCMCREGEGWWLGAAPSFIDIKQQTEKLILMSLQNSKNKKTKTGISLLNRIKVISICTNVFIERGVSQR